MKRKKKQGDKALSKLENAVSNDPKGNISREAKKGDFSHRSRNNKRVLPLFVRGHVCR